MKTIFAYAFRSQWAAKIVHWEHPQEPKFEMALRQRRHLILNTDIGDLVRWGHRPRRGIIPPAHWGVVEANGVVREISKSEAIALWKGRKHVKVMDSESVPVLRDSCR